MSEVRRETLLPWLDATFDMLRSSPARRWLDANGVDVLDALTNPIYANVLAAARSGPRPEETMIDRLKARAYQYKLLLREAQTSKSSLAITEGHDVILWPRTPPHVKQVLPVYRALVAAGMRPMLLASQPSITEAIEKAGLHAVHAWAELWPQLTYARARGARAARQVQQLKFDVAPASFADPRVLAGVVQDEVARQLPLIHEITAIVRAVEKRAKPAVFVVGNDLTPEGRATCLALAKRVPVACLMHGIGSGNPLIARHLADRILVYGDLNRAQLMSLGISAERIRVIGAPYLDDLPKQSNTVNPKIAQHLGEPRDARPRVLMAVSGPGDKISLEHHQKVIAAMHRASVELEGVRFIAKLHPKDRADHYRSDRSKLAVVEAKTPNLPSDIFEWLQGTTVLVTGGSAVAMEAMLLDVPVITADFEGTLGGVDFIAEKATLHTRNADELVAAIRRACLEPGSLGDVRAGARRYLEKKLGPLDGRAAHRAALALKELTTRN